MEMYIVPTDDEEGEQNQEGQTMDEVPKKK